MNLFRIALANIRFPASPDESIALAEQAIDRAALEKARIVCFPECFVPGYRGIGKSIPPADPDFLERAWSVVARAAARNNLTVVLGTERWHDGGLAATVLVIDPDGSRAGFQDKVQIDPSEEGIYDGTLLCYQPYGQEGLLVADIDLSTATGLLAARCRTEP